jgi:hypothetical protein
MVPGGVRDPFARPLERGDVFAREHGAQDLPDPRVVLALGLAE